MASPTVPLRLQSMKIKILLVVVGLTVLPVTGDSASNTDDAIGSAGTASTVPSGAEVQVSGGAVRGLVRHSRSGRQYHAFRAIPYAQPPVDRNRFMVCVL